MAPNRAEKNIPASAPTMAPMTYASSLTLTAGTPTASLAVSSSRRLRQARPSRDRDSHEEQAQVVLGVARQDLCAEDAGGRDAVQAVRAASPGEVSRHDPDDFAKAQGHDREVVAAQPQRWVTDDAP